MRRGVAFVLPLALAIGACGREPVAPENSPIPEEPLLQQGGRPERGTGLALESFTQGLPLVGDVQITEVVITEFATFLGGLTADVTVTGTTVDALGNAITVTQDVTADVLISSTGRGCELVTIDLGPIGADLFGVAGVDIPAATVAGRGSGPVGTILCNVARLASGIAGGVVGGLVNALNALIR